MGTSFVRHLLIGLCLCATATPAWADTPVGRIRVQATDQAGQPVPARIRVFRFGEFDDTTIRDELPEGRHASMANKGEEPWSTQTPGETRETTRLDLTTGPDGTPLQPGFYRVYVSTGSGDDRRFAEKIVYVGPGTSPTITLGPAEQRPVVGAQLNADDHGARAAVEAGNKAEYDEYMTSARARVAEEAENLRDLDAAIEAYRLANGIPPFRNAREVRRAINAGQGTDVPVDQAKIDALEVLEDLLRYRAFMQTVYEAAQRKLRAIPAWPAEPRPEGTKTSYLPPAQQGVPVSHTPIGAPFAGAFPGGVKVSLDYAAAFTSPKFNLETNFGSFEGGGSDTLSSIGIDVRGNLGQISDDLPLNVFVGAWARVNLGGDEQNGLKLDLHPTPGHDTRAYFATDGFAMPYVGVGAEIENFADTGTDIYWSLYAGLRIESRTLTLVTDETGGAGQVNRFETSHTEANLTLGWDVDFECEEQPIFFRVGGAVDFKSPIRLDERSTLGNRYELETDSEADYRLILGVGYRF
jgi:hypothetical protein